MTATTTTETMLLRAVLETPYDDSPRLILADEIEGTEPERAEFIRVQIAREQDPDYHGFLCLVDAPCRNCEHEKWLFGSVAHSYFKEWNSGQIAAFSSRDRYTAIGAKGSNAQVAIFRRGFVDEIECTAGEWIGGPCRKCYIRREGEQIIRDGCNHCNGTGRSEGIARQVCERWPVTTVRLTDKRPAEWNDENGNSSYVWVDQTNPNSNTEFDIDPELFKHLHGGILNRERWNRSYETLDLAVKALSLAAVQYGRSLAGLPPL